MKSGVIGVYKELGYTSSDAVVILKKLLRTKKVGHAGTLDPQAEGVLPVCVGKATRLSDYLMRCRKVYRAQLVLGTATDTQDASGTVTETSSVLVSESELRALLPRFIGEIEQIPPMYSALKRGGKKLYELARAGVEIEREPRKIHIGDLQLLSQDDENRFSLLVTCSKGTYIRTLCADLARAAGTCGHMAALQRVSCGGFEIGSTHRLSEIRSKCEAGDFSFMIPPDEAVSWLPRADVSEEYRVPFLNGRPVPVQMANVAEAAQPGQEFRMYTRGEFCGISRLEGTCFKICCMLREDEKP